MPVEVVMPKFGLTMQEGTIQRWYKAEGEAVRQGEPLFEVETEKVLYDVEAPASGVVAALLYAAESTVTCARIVAVIALNGEDPVGIGARYATMPTAATAAAAGVPMASTRDAPRRGGIVATPAARKLAKDHGVDLAALAGSGPGGRITREDVEAALATAPPSGAAPPTGVLLSGMRKTIAERMLRSLQTTAQLTVTTEADVTPLVTRYRALRSELRITYTDLLVEAVAATLAQHPRLRVTIEDDTIHPHNDSNVGVAVAVEDGLIVPVIRAANRKPLRQIAAESGELAQKARAGTLSLEEVSDGTFTITNLGTYGIDAFTPILNPPQVAILGVGRISEKPAVHGGQIAIRSLMTLSLTFDHRVVDGVPAAAFLRDLVAYLQGRAPDLA